MARAVACLRATSATTACWKTCHLSQRAQSARDQRQTTYLMTGRNVPSVDQSLCSAASLMIDDEGQSALRRRTMRRSYENILLRQGWRDRKCAVLDISLRTAYHSAR